MTGSWCRLAWSVGFTDLRWFAVTSGLLCVSRLASGLGWITWGPDNHCSSSREAELFSGIGEGVGVFVCGVWFLLLPGVAGFLAHQTSLVNKLCNMG